MQTLGKGGAAHKAGFVGVLAGLFLVGAHTASAQTSTPPANPADNAPSEAARRAAASPYRFILQNATAPRKAAAPAPAPAPVSAVAEPKRAPAPPPVQQAAVQPSASQAPARAAPAPAPQPEIAAPPPPAPEPAVASISRQVAEPPPPRREIIPIQTDEPRLSPALLREQPKGVVKVHFDIQPNGTVSEVKILASSNRSLNRPTVEAIQGWKFQPVDEILTVETELVYKMDQ